MIAFRVNDMTCGHCASTITRAVQEVDPQARVQVDLAAHRVDIESGQAEAARLQGAIAAAGYTPIELAASAAATAPAQGPARGG
jgi:copper chaperone